MDKILKTISNINTRIREAIKSLREVRQNVAKLG